MGFDLDLLGSSPEEPEADALAHYGKKGMRWGVTTTDDSSGGSSSKGDGESSNSTPSAKKGMTPGQKKALKYAAGGALAVGGVIAIGILAKNGKLPISSLRPPAPGSLAAETKRLAKIDARATADQAARQKLMRSMTTNSAKSAKDFAARTRLLDEAAIRNNAAQARQQMADKNLAAELARRRAVTQKGKDSVEALKASAALKKSISDFRKQIEDDHREQTRRMIDDSARAGISYNPARDNPYSPEARRKR